MKSLTGRIALKHPQVISDPQRSLPQFDQYSLLWQLSLPGLNATAALRGLLLQAVEKFGEIAFPYRRTAQALYDQQQLIFGGGISPEPVQRPSIQHWGQAVWLDFILRPKLPSPLNWKRYPEEALYQEHLRFAGLVGLPSNRLPVSWGAFTGWAQASLPGWKMENYRKLALSCICEALPLCWPVNIAVVFYLLPPDFFRVYDQVLGRERRQLASVVDQVFTKLSCSHG